MYQYKDLLHNCNFKCVCVCVCVINGIDYDRMESDIFRFVTYIYSI
jgi:hypothetical protein